MPAEGQIGVTIPVYVWDRARAYYDAHRVELRKRGIKSTTRLICLWIEEAAR